MLNALKSLARKYNYPESYAGFWMDVARMESDGFNSVLFLKNNNPWGMKVSTKRDHKQVVSNSQWANYKSVGDALEDIFLYMKARGYRKDIEQLDQFVNHMASKSYFVGETPYTYYQKVIAQKTRNHA